MNKSFLTSLVTVLLLSFAGMVQAGERSHYRGYESNRGHGSVNQYRGHSGNQYRGRQNARHYSYRPDRYSHHSSRHDVRSGLKVVAGALVLGSIIHAVNDNHRERVVYRTRAPVARRDYWYRVDGDGQCVEVQLNSRGEEVWTYTDPSYCY